LKLPTYHGGGEFDILEQVGYIVGDLGGTELALLQQIGLVVAQRLVTHIALEELELNAPQHSIDVFQLPLCGLGCGARLALCVENSLALK
jgi:hypothetical protein